jgi:spermidine/putrescine-binding protein
MAAALSYLGYSINTQDEEELREAADLIAATTDRLAAFDSDQFEDLLVSGETAVAHGYSGDFFTAFDETEGGYDDYTYLIPQEGAVRWVDNMAILADAPHPCTAHTFINFILDARNGAQLTNWVFYASPNEAAEEFIDAEILEDPAIYPPEDVLANLSFIEDTGEAETLYTDLFTEAKS